MTKINCWEYKKCGKEDTCPAGLFMEADKFLGGMNGGRACAYVSGTFCSGNIQGTHVEKAKNCGKCDFYQLLRKDNGLEMSVLSFSRYLRKNQTNISRVQQFFSLIKSEA